MKYVMKTARWKESTEEIIGLLYLPPDPLSLVSWCDVAPEAACDFLLIVACIRLDTEEEQ